MPIIRRLRLVAAATILFLTFYASMSILSFLSNNHDSNNNVIVLDPEAREAQDLGISVARLRRNKQLQERIGKAHDALRKLEESEPDIWIRPDKDEYAALKNEVRKVIHNGILWGDDNQNAMQILTIYFLSSPQTPLFFVA